MSRLWCVFRHRFAGYLSPILILYIKLYYYLFYCDNGEIVLLIIIPIFLQFVGSCWREDIEDEADSNSPVDENVSTFVISCPYSTCPIYTYKHTFKVDLMKKNFTVKNVLATI